MTLQIDGIGFEILRRLVENGRISHTELGKEVGLSSSSVYNRVQHLEHCGVIQGYTTLLDPQKLGYGVTAFVFVQTAARPDEYQDTHQFILSSPFITEAYDVTGSAMYLLKIQARSLEELGELLKSLRALPVVTGTETLVSLATLKSSSFVPETPVSGSTGYSERHRGKGAMTISTFANRSLKLLETERMHDSGVYDKHDLVLTRGEGALVWDVGGQEYVDCVGGYGVSNVGHSNQMVVRAVQEQAARLMVCAQSFPNDRRAEFLEELVSVLPEGLERVWLCNSGTEAMEAAIKFARTATGRHKYVAMRRGFSGRTMGSLSLTWEPKYREPFLPLLHETTFVDFNDLQALETAVDDQTVAVVLEPVQGEGGVYPGTKEFIRKARELTHRHGALLVFDEIQTGFCRTGAFFALEHFGVIPDLMTLAKGMGGGMPIGALVMTEAVAKTMPRGGHGTTFGGNPLAMAAGTAAIRFMKTERLWENAQVLGSKFRKDLGAIRAPRVREVRGLGLMVGLELDRPSAPYIHALEHEHRILALQAGSNVIRYLPPLVISSAELDRVVDATAQVLQTVH